MKIEQSVQLSAPELQAPELQAAPAQLDLSRATFPDPRSSLIASATSLREAWVSQGMLSPCRNEINAVVQSFRAQHGYGSMVALENRKLTWQDLAQLVKTASDSYPLSCVTNHKEREAIEYLANPANYAEIRVRGRARNPSLQLSESQLDTLCGEIAVAFVWRALYRQTESS